MFPIIGLLCANGTAGLLQYPILGYWLAFPTLLVLIERITRISCGFHRISATLGILDADTVVINVTISNHRYWPYKAGQYIFLQVPRLSLFQWHHFTICTFIGNEIQVHIKTDGDWTSKLRQMVKEGQTENIYVGIDGPFGAPAQRFYNFDQSIILGSGIGVTPFSGILTDLQAQEDHQRESEPPVRRNNLESTSSKKPSVIPNLSKYRRVDFHWIVKDKNYLLWFSDLLPNVDAEREKTGVLLSTIS
jgi:dual oxidase